MLNIRPHHIFCMALFGGAGYSETFAENMTAVIASLKSGEPCTIVDGHDSICAACPNLLADGGCALGGNVLHRDSGAKSTANLKAGETATLAQLAARTLQSLTPDRFENTCGGCRWMQTGYCNYEKLCESLEALRGC